MDLYTFCNRYCTVNTNVGIIKLSKIRIKCKSAVLAVFPTNCTVSIADRDSILKRQVLSGRKLNHLILGRHRRGIKADTGFTLLDFSHFDTVDVPDSLRTLGNGNILISGHIRIEFGRVATRRNHTVDDRLRIAHPDHSRFLCNFVCKYTAGDRILPISYDFCKSTACNGAACTILNSSVKNTAVNRCSRRLFSFFIVKFIACNRRIENTIGNGTAIIYHGSIENTA